MRINVFAKPGNETTFVFDLSDISMRTTVELNMQIHPDERMSEAIDKITNELASIVRFHLRNHFIQNKGK